MGVEYDYLENPGSWVHRRNAVPHSLSHVFNIQHGGLLFLADFASMSISTDNVKHSLKPDSHIMNIAEGVLFTMALFSYFGLSGA